MKTIYSILIIFLFLSFAGKAQQQTTQNNVKAIQLASQNDSLQYAIGAFIGQWMIKNSFEVQNANLFLQGMDDVLQNKPLAVSDTIIAPLVSAYQISNQNVKQQQLEEQLFTSLKGKAGVGALPNGVHYIVKEQGSGVRPTLKDTVIIHTVGMFPDGTVFEDTYKNNQELTIAISNLISGLSEAIQLMPEQSVWRIFIPSVQAYGSAGKPGVIPPYAALVFDVALINVK